MRPPWAYTVGLTAASQPELVVTGLPLARATDLLNGVAAHAMHAAAPRPGEQVRLRGGPLIEIVEVAGAVSRSSARGPPRSAGAASQGSSPADQERMRTMRGAVPKSVSAVPSSAKPAAR